MRVLMMILSIIFLIIFPMKSNADEKTKDLSYEEIQSSVNQLEKDWDSMRKEYAKKFKDQLNPLNQKIAELKNSLDNGDAGKRKQLNEQLEGLKKSRDAMRQALHEITATSVIKIAGIQKYFKNAKDDTKD